MSGEDGNNMSRGRLYVTLFVSMTCLQHYPHTFLKWFDPTGGELSSSGPEFVTPPIGNLFKYSHELPFAGTCVVSRALAFGRIAFLSQGDSSSSVCRLFA